MIAGFFFLMFNMTYNLNKSAAEGDELVSEQYKEEAARSSARSAMNNALAKIRISPSFRGTYFEEDRYVDGTIDSVTILGAIQPGSIITITAKGWYGNDADPSAQNHTVIATTRALASPPNYGYALCSGGNLQLHGDINVVNDIDTTMNADLHANGNIEISGSNNIVKGFGSYVGGITGAGIAAFQPPYNPLGLPVHSRGAKVTIPSFNASSYEAKANRTTVGNLTVTDTLHLGTRTNPTIWYVSGSVNLQGVISGYGVIYSTGGVTISGNLTEQTADPYGENLLALYTSNTVTINAGVTADAMILSKGNALMGSNSILRGNVVTRGNCEYNGPVQVRYRISNTNLIAPFWGGNSRVIVESYYE